MELGNASIMMIALVVVASYLAGSVPFGLLITRLGGKGDIRNIGSGNIGATNVLRTGSKKLAFLTLIADGGKGAVMVLVVASMTDNPLLYALAGAATVIGHCFPVWLGFQGGKGVATCVAVYAAFDIRLGLIFVTLWLSTAALTRYSSLAALVAMLGCSVGAMWLSLPFPVMLAVIVMSGLSWARHHENIGRLLTGTESRIGKR